MPRLWLMGVAALCLTAASVLFAWHSRLFAQVAVTVDQYRLGKLEDSIHAMETVHAWVLGLLIATLAAVITDMAMRRRGK